MDAHITLMVKGSEQEAREAAARHGLDVTRSDAKRWGEYVTLSAHGPAGMLLASAVFWLAEDREVPPGGYPPGSLVWHGAPEVAS